MNTIYRIFAKGLLTILPITLTVYLVAWLINTLENGFASPVKRFLPESAYVPGLGLILSLAFIFIIGLLVNNLIANQILSKIESSLKGIPLVNAIYSPLKDVMNLFAGDQQGGKRTVLVTMAPGVRALGLVTRDDFSDIGNIIGNTDVAVFVPFSYAMGGYTIIVNKSQLSEVDLSAEKAMQLSLTAWVKSRDKA
jgi:uncharacterized membrane protein